MSEKILSLLQSRRFWAAVVGVIVVVASHMGLEIDPEKLLATVALIASWIIGDSLNFAPRDCDEESHVMARLRFRNASLAAS